MNPQYAEVARRAGHRCEYCHAPEVIFNFPFEVEHILPRQEPTRRNRNWLWRAALATFIRRRDYGDRVADNALASGG